MLTALSCDDDARERGRKRRRRASTDLSVLRRHGSPAETSNVIDSGFVCENPDCDAFGDAVES